MTDPTPEFNGFPQAAVQFLRDLAENNNKTWFEDNKPTYIEQVQQPAIALVSVLGAQLQAAYPAITYDPRPHNGSLMRIYRDTRFSKDKTPYKTNVAMMFSVKGQKKMAAPGFGLQITPEQVELIAGQFAFGKDHLEAYREAVADDKHGAALVNAAKAVESAGDYPIQGKELKRVPSDYPADHPRGEWLKYKGLYVTTAFALETAYTPELVAAAMTHFRNMAPLEQWLELVLPL